MAVGGQEGEAGVPQASRKGHLWASAEARVSLSPSRREPGGSEHRGPSWDLSGTLGVSCCLVQALQEERGQLPSLGWG